MIRQFLKPPPDLLSFTPFHESSAVFGGPFPERFDEHTYTIRT